MNIYNIISKAYDLLDIVYFNEIGKKTRQVIMNMIPNKKINILDMCCGTLSNTITIASCKPDTKVVGLDLSKDMLRVAKKKLYKKCISEMCGCYQNKTERTVF